MASVDFTYWWKALSIGASVTTLMGFFGFVVACIFLAYLVRTRAETRRLALLSPKDRRIIVDNYFSRYKLTLENLPDDNKYDLVRREMTLRFRRQLSLSVLSAAVFLICVIVLAFTPSPKPSGRQRTPADQLVIDYMREIENLRGDFEAKNPGWRPYVRREGRRLVNLIGQINEDQLNPSRRIIQHEYKGWALLIVARTFTDPGEPEKEQRKQRIEYAAQAIREFDLALSRMQEVVQRFKAGDPDAAVDYEWITTEGEDLYRVQYLKAVAFAVVARAGGDHTKEEVQATLAKLPTEYLKKYPAPNNPDLRWAVSP